jgi:hypothetical protein
MSHFKINILLIGTFFWSLCSHAATPIETNSRLLNHLDATQGLSQLHFYHHGQGMHLSPGLINKLDFILRTLEGTQTHQKIEEVFKRRWGIQNVNGKMIGLNNIKDQNLSIGVLSCVACHSGKAAGQYVIGIGNKNIDPGQIGQDGVLVEEKWKSLTDKLNQLGLYSRKNDFFREVENSSLKLMKKLADPTMSAQTQGLVPVSLVGDWFYEQTGIPKPEHQAVGAVKVPTWFGYGEKIKTGQFVDGIGDGNPPGWIIGVEIASGQSADNIREQFSKVEQTKTWLSNLLPPKYPFQINESLAFEGKQIFEMTCAKCHGTYEHDAHQLPLYQQPKIIPWEKIQTDTDRLDYVSDSFLNALLSSPLNDLIRPSVYAGKRMYIAPRLHAIWARFPYLHNASVPTLRDLLSPTSQRPTGFSLMNAGELDRFDKTKIGLTTVSLDTVQKPRQWYQTGLKGQSNQGHEKFVDFSEHEKDAIIEYLKTL